IWLDDGEHFLQTKEGRSYKVNALTGRCEPFYDPDKAARGLGGLPALGGQANQALPQRWNPQHTGVLFTYDRDLYFSANDGTSAVRLTKTPGIKELPSFSPDGKFVAFVRDGNLYTVDIATQTEHALTSDGTGLILNGKPDWVYMEEIFDRRRPA